jgi:hypothetical protein
MTESGFTGRKFYRGIAWSFCVFFFATISWAQEDAPVPLGDVARSFRKKKDQPAPQPQPAAPAKTIIDNDNLTQVMDEVQSHRLAGSSLLYSFDSSGKTFQVSAPDVTCSLSFNSNTASLLSRPYVPIDLPDDELRKLDGPATLNEDGLQVSVFNGTQWRVEEITVGLTIVRHVNQAARPYATGRLVQAAEETVISAQKQPDTTTIHHLRATALPATTAMFKAHLDVHIGPEEEWHWAILQAKGVPPANLMAIPPASTSAAPTSLQPAATTATAPPAASVPQISPATPQGANAPR